MTDAASFQRLQHALSAQIRDPLAPPALDMPPHRLQVYRELVHHTIDGCLSSAFPVLKRLCGEDRWTRLIRAFLLRHRSRAPQLHRLPEELLACLRSGLVVDAADPPFLYELAHYEWVELALSISPLELPLDAADAAGDLMAQPPLVSPLAWSLTYSFPVHRIDETFRPDSAAAMPTWLVVNRDREDRVRFLQVNAATAQLLALIEASPTDSGHALLSRLATTLRHPQPQQVIAQGEAIFEQLRERDIVLGTRRASAEPARR